MEKTITEIPAKSEFLKDPYKHVGIYCRVSSASKKQLKSLAAQASGLARRVATRTFWKLEDIYLDVATGRDAKREEYRRMLYDASKGKINLVVVKSSSRLGRDALEVTEACRELQKHGCDIYFDNADDYYSKMGDLIVEITAGIDQAENEIRGENISWGIRRKIEGGSPEYFDRVCYGYERGEDGSLIIREDQATIVRKIFMLYMSGYSVLKIKRTLEGEGIPAPRGGKSWPKKTIDMILVNGKYAGVSYVRTHSIAEGDYGKGVVMSGEKGERYILYGVKNNNPPIIPPETFEKAQQMREERSNVVCNADGTKTRKSTRYSSKQITDER